MPLTERTYNVVTCGDLRGHSVAVASSVSVPLMMNKTKLAAGEELLLEVAPKAPAKRKGKDVSWKDDVMAKAKAKGEAKA